MAEKAGKWKCNQRRVQEWCATPRAERIPPTQELLAAQLGVGDRTITRWRQLEGWQEEVNALARNQVGVKLPEVYGALLREAEKGSYQHIQLVLELLGEYVRTQRNEHTGPYGGPIEIREVEVRLSDDAAVLPDSE